MLLGQLVAISVASNLFYAAIVLQTSRPLTPQKPSSSKKASVTKRLKVTETEAESIDIDSTPLPILTLWAPVLLSLYTIYTTPNYSGTSLFLPNLLLMHALLVIPLIPPFSKSPQSYSVKQKGGLSAWTTLPNLYTAIACISALIRARTLLPLIGSSPSSTYYGSLPLFERITNVSQDLLEILLNFHPAQSSIGFDVVWTSVSFLIWAGFDERTKGNRVVESVTMLLGCIGTSIGVVAPDYLRSVDRSRATIPSSAAEVNSEEKKPGTAVDGGKGEKSDKKAEE